MNDNYRNSKNINSFIMKMNCQWSVPVLLNLSKKYPVWQTGLHSVAGSIIPFSHVPALAWYSIAGGGVVQLQLSGNPARSGHFSVVRVVGSAMLFPIQSIKVAGVIT